MISEGKYIYIIDMGSHHTPKLISAVGELRHYVTAKHYSKIDRGVFKNLVENYDGLIISGSRKNIGEDDFPNLPFVHLPNIPVLAICYGMQLIGHKKGANIIPCNKGLGEKGEYDITLLKESILWDGLEANDVVFHFHEHMIEKAPPGWTVTSSTKDCPVASMEKDNKYFCTQFHPECHVVTKNVIIKNFIEKIC